MTKEQCSTVPRQACTSVPKEVCKISMCMLCHVKVVLVDSIVPRQACTSVPKEVSNFSTLAALDIYVNSVPCENSCVGYFLHLLVRAQYLFD